MRFRGVSIGAEVNVNAPTSSSREASGDLQSREHPKVVGLGATCDRPGPTNADGSEYFTVGEFVILENGDRLMLHSSRGWTSSGVLGGPVPLSPAVGLTPTELIRRAWNVALTPDECEITEGRDVDRMPHWRWLAELAQRRGLDTTPEQLRDLPYEVQLSQRVLRWIEQHN